MSFVDHMPEPPPHVQQPTEQPWSPPLWDRPSEGTLPAVVGVSQLFARTEKVALALDHLRRLPERVPDRCRDRREPAAAPDALDGWLPGGLAPGREPVSNPGRRRAPTLATASITSPRSAMGPRIGVQFSNGQRAGARTQSPFDVAKDDAGIPTEPVIFPGGGGGGGGQYRWPYWVFPLPTPGPLELFAEWPTAGIAETRVVVSGDDVREAASRAIVLWS